MVREIILPVNVIGDNQTCMYVYIRKAVNTSAIYSQDFKKASWISGRLSESLNILVEFFHADGKGLAMPCLNCTLYEVSYLLFHLIISWI